MDRASGADVTARIFPLTRKFSNPTHVILIHLVDHSEDLPLILAPHVILTHHVDLKNPKAKLICDTRPGPSDHVIRLGLSYLTFAGIGVDFGMKVVNKQARK